jgi:hypothetical protein
MGAFMSDVENAKLVSRQPEFVNTQNIGVDVYGQDWSGNFRAYNYDIADYHYHFCLEKYYYRITRIKLSNTVFNNIKLKNTAYNFLYWYTQRDSTKFPDWEFKILTKATRSGL